MPEFRYHGFDHPPYGLMDVISLSDAPKDSIFYILDAIGNTPPLDDILGLAKHNLYVIIHTHEGACHLWFNRLIRKLNETCHMPLERIILHSGCLYDPESPIKHVGSIVDYASNLATRYAGIKRIDETDPTYHYVCLNRLHRWQRYELVSKLLDLELSKYGKISYIETPHLYDPRFPIFLNQDLHHVDHAERIGLCDIFDLDPQSGALFSIISETAYEPLPGQQYYANHPRPGFTEKTYKSLYAGQIPIFLAAQYSVRCWRDLGFDVFDDVIDHGYDNETDPKRRIDLVAAQIEKITKFSLKDLTKIKQDLRRRLQANLDLFLHYSHNYRSELPKWNRIFTD